MSGKRRKKGHIPSGKQEILRTESHPLLKKASDGYQNSLAGLGDASPLLSGGTFIKSGLTSNLELLTTLYRESWIAKRSFYILSEDKTRFWIRIIHEMFVMDMAGSSEISANPSLRPEPGRNERDRRIQSVELLR